MTEQESQPQDKKEPEVEEQDCPNCGSAKTVGRTLFTQEAAKHGTKLPPNTKPFIQISQLQIGTNVVTFMFDACEDCKTVYLVAQQTRSNLAIPQVDLRNIRLPHPGFGAG